MSRRTACRVIGIVLAVASAGCGAVAPPDRPPARPLAGVDLRPEFAARGLPPRQQGQRGACQVFAFVGVLEYELAAPGRPADLSEQFLMWAANDACGLTRMDGFNPDLLVRGIRKHGIPHEAAIPYIPKKEPIPPPTSDAVASAGRRLGAEVTSIKHWSSPIGFTDEHMSQLRQRLDAGRPVTATFCWPFGIPDKDIVTADHFLIDRDIDGTSKDGHGVVLVGYALEPTVPGGGYFHFRNSWGTGFADGGYAKIDFAMARKYGTDAYAVSLPSGAK